MHTKKMPGFSADASCYRSIAYHQVGGMLSGLRQERNIVPAMRCKAGGGWYCCGSDALHCCTNLQGFYMVCNGTAFEGVYH
jgi:hypothetical protein